MIYERMGYFVGNYDSFGLKCDPKDYPFMKGTQRDVKITDKVEWEETVTQVFGVCRERVPKVDFTARKVILIVTEILRENEFPAISQVFPNDKELSLGVSIYKTQSWICSLPKHIVLAISVDVNKSAKSGRLYDVIDLDRVTPSVTTAIEMEKNDSKEIEDLNATIRMIRLHEPAHSVDVYEKRLGKLLDKREKLTDIDEARKQARIKLMGPQLN